MDTKNSRALKIYLVVGLLVIVTLSCDLPGLSPGGDEIPTSEVTEPAGPGPGGSTIAGPVGVTLNVEEGALSDASGVEMEALPPDELPWGETPFEVDGQQFRLMLGSGVQTGGITMTIPLPEEPDPTRRFVYAAWVMPDEGEPSLVGALVQGRQVTFPVIGAGKYQLIRILHYADIAKLYNEKEPLNVPTYRQMTPSWCSPTALTDLAGYHQGAWPVGGYGSAWGESSNWFLAGQAGQPFDKGYFFHWLLGAAGYSPPVDVKQSFIDGNVIVFIWNWKAYKIEEPVFYTFDPLGLTEYYINSRLDYADELFVAFRSFVESNLWGSKRPVAWGSSLAGHSRILTGSDGTTMYFNNPSSGSWNETKPWDVYHQEIIDSLYAQKTEVIDTAVFMAEARPASQRRAVLWLLPWTDNYQGSIVLRQGSEGTQAVNWVWDGEANHDYGYYYQDLTGSLPSDPILDTSFKAGSYQDVVEFGYSVQSISGGNYDYSVLPELYNIGGQVDVGLDGQDVSVPSGQHVNTFPAGSFPIAGLDPGLYRLKFTLFQGNIVQDVKYVFFQIAPHGVLPMPHFEAITPAFCREGPGSVYKVVTGFYAGQELGLVGFNPERTWGKVEATMNAITFQCWVSLDNLEIPEGLMVPTIEFHPIPTVTITPNFCSQFTTPTTCATHPECTWDRMVGYGYCKSK